MQVEDRGQAPKDWTPSFDQSSLPSIRHIGALVVGGDFQGLGIVRSLGRQGVPVCVIDDEASIARFSRYATHNYKGSEAV